MSLLFQPRCPPQQPATAVAAYRTVTGCGLAEAATGDVVADLERLAHALATERIASDGALSGLEFSVETRVVGGAGCAEWVGTAERVPAGGRVSVRGVTLVDLDGDRITAVRHYWDEPARLEGLAAPPRD